MAFIEFQRAWAHLLPGRTRSAFVAWMRAWFSNESLSSRNNHRSIWDRWNLRAIDDAERDGAVGTGRNEISRILPIATVAAVVCLFGVRSPAQSQGSQQWTESWISAQQDACEPGQLPKQSFQGATLRETVHLSLGGSQIRLVLSNLFGKQPLIIKSVRVARAKPGTPGEIEKETSVRAHFKGAKDVSIAPGAEATSDAISIAVEPLSELAVSIKIGKAPACATSHPGARATAFLTKGDQTAKEQLAGAERFEHWYFLSRVGVAGGASKGAITAFGDSITDGHGATTDKNDRWTDVLASRLAPQGVAVLNAGIGGNRLLLDGLGPSGISRFDRDALGADGVRAVIILEGINDIGMLDREKEHLQEDHDALVNRLETAMKGMVEKAHLRGVCVFGGTLTPFLGSEYYHPGRQSEADREKLNTWIRTSGVFDGMIDFDKMMSDPRRPDHLAADVDSGDHLHPGPVGYGRMGEGVPLNLLTAKGCSPDSQTAQH
jgi:lysophospholipase L1-like esterase